jgi:SAM-dependent methyltransferase
MMDRSHGGVTGCYICSVDDAAQTEIGTVKPTVPTQFLVNEYTLVHCSSCDAIRLEPRPPAQDLKTLYQYEQFSIDHYRAPERVALVLAYLGDRLDNRGLLPASGEAVLEFGAGLAWMARACKQRNPDIRTFALDITLECVDKTPWVDHYIVGSLQDLPPEQKFRLISLTHVIEHLPDPAATLRDLAVRLQPSGRLFVTAPFRPVGWRQGAGVTPWLDYYLLHVPAHVSYLSERWFRQRLGLRLVSWEENHENGQAFEAILAPA